MRIHTKFRIMNRKTITEAVKGARFLRKSCTSRNGKLFALLTAQDSSSDERVYANIGAATH